MPDRTLGPVEAQIRALRENKVARGKLRTAKLNELQKLVDEIPATKPRKEGKWRTRKNSKRSAKRISPRSKKK